jgi:hypothetical protein
MIPPAGHGGSGSCGIANPTIGPPALFIHKISRLSDPLSICPRSDDYCRRRSSRQNGETFMRYLCLIYYDEKKLNALAQSERQTLSEESYAYCDLLRQKGQFIAAEPLEPVHTATTVRVKAGKVATTDGPFAETKEQLGAFFMIDVADLNEAVRVASKIPAGRIGSVEVRPIKEGGCA